MADIQKLVDTDSVRNVLTVSPADLPDEVLHNYGLEDEVQVFLDFNYPDWEDVSDTAGEETKKYRLLSLMCKYLAASIVAETAPVFILKKMSDGNNEDQRSDRDGFGWIADKFRNKAYEYLSMLDDDQSQFSQAELVGISQPDRDVIITPRDIR